MEALNDEMNKRGLNSVQQTKVRKYFQYKQSLHEGESSFKKEEGFLDSLPRNLREEVLSSVNAEVIEEISFLKHFSRECKVKISLAIQQKVFFPEEVVFTENERGSSDSIFYVAFGAVTLFLAVNSKLPAKYTHVVQT